jgi:insulysin
LFDPSCKDREINAVDSEHKKNLQEDEWRLHQLEKTICDQKHAYAKFGSGSSETLRDWPLKEGLDVRDELIKFHSHYYSANLMKLAVLGREPLDQLTQWVVEKFSAVRNKNLLVPTFGGSPLTENQLKVGSLG